jgi:hypothetical protein
VWGGRGGRGVRGGRNDDSAMLEGISETRGCAVAYIIAKFKYLCKCSIILRQYIEINTVSERTSLRRNLDIRPFILFSSLRNIQSL